MKKGGESSLKGLLPFTWSVILENPSRGSADELPGSAIGVPARGIVREIREAAAVFCGESCSAAFQRES